MDKKRNGLLEIYRFIICFWPLYYHNYFFWERDYSVFTVCDLAVDFFFVLSGFFLMSSMRRLKDEPVFKGMIKLMFGRAKPMLFTICFIAAFNFICVALFVRENYFKTLFHLFKYWWFVLYLIVVIGVLYLVYRILKNEKLFVVFLVILSLSMARLQYAVVVEERYIDQLVFFARSCGCVPVGILLSYIPKIKFKKFNAAILAVIALIPTLFYFAYNEKTFFTRLLIIAMFCALVYFSVHINVSGGLCDVLGKLSVRMYLYMAFITMIEMLGVTNFRQLFVIDVAVASLDLAVSYYRDKYKALKNQQQKQASEFVSATK